MLCPWQYFTSAATLSTSSGTATASGSTWNALASVEYRPRVSRSKESRPRNWPRRSSVICFWSSTVFRERVLFLDLAVGQRLLKVLHTLVGHLRALQAEVREVL